MKTLQFLLLFIVLGTTNAQAQLEESTDFKRWRGEVEPGYFFLRGYSAMVGYNLDPNFMIGLYSAASDVPEFAKAGFNFLGDSAEIRLPFQIALNFRYKIPAIKKWETNPVVGLVAGWEKFNIVNPGQDDLEISTFVFTSYLGMEIYLYKKMVYLLPQMRTVVYYGSKKSDESRAEELDSYILPQVSLGVRF